MHAHHRSSLVVGGIVAVSLLAALPAVGRSQSFETPDRSSPAARTFSFGVGGGVIVPREGASAHSLRTGVQGQGFVLLRLPGGLPALRFNVDYARSEFDPASLAFSPSSEPGVVSTADRSVLAGVASLRMELLHGPVRPYVLAGVGAFRVKDVLTVPEQGTTSFSDTDLGVDGGAGVAFRVGRLQGFVETRIQNVYTKERGLVDTGSVRAFPVTFGLIF